MDRGKILTSLNSKNIKNALKLC